MFVSELCQDFIICKECSKCGEIKLLKDFIKNKQCQYGRAGTCSDCDRIYKNQHYLENITRKRHLANKKNRERKDQAVGLLGGRCYDCGGEFHRCCYDFHHTDGSKEMNPSKALAGSWNNAVKELQKCILLCANCHRLRHFKEVDGDESTY
jgi:hypothetical protein